MAQSTLPFVFDRTAPLHSHQELKKRLSKALWKACEESLFLTEYLRYVPFDEVGIPSYEVKPSRNLGGAENPNIIYPIEDGLFVHIYPDPLGARNHHVHVPLVHLQ